MLRLYRVAPDVTTLGPGKRFCIWVQGCDKHCPDCMSKETWSHEKGYCIEESELVERMLQFDFEGITISGGEPMLQSKALAQMIRLLRQKRDCGVMVYTGYTLEELRGKNDESIDDFLLQIDLLIDGEYIAELDDNGALRGSSNQRKFCFTDRYRDALDKEFGLAASRQQQLQIDEFGMLLIGLRENHRTEDIEPTDC